MGSVSSLSFFDSLLVSPIGSASGAQARSGIAVSSRKVQGSGEGQMQPAGRGELGTKVEGKTGIPRREPIYPVGGEPGARAEASILGF